ncbi:hypothetical protein [Streptomyces sp. NPDC020917]|uniref:hypothetical protein n=1 Tax=Streptomyces sp. NPDC020917 TaxID=3365102 RepID=UPI003794B19C
MTVEAAHAPRHVLEDELLRVEIAPALGATITSIRHRPSGAELLWRNPRFNLPASQAESGVDLWLRAGAGGWQLVLPNGGTECTYQGVSHGFHGEAGLQSWRARAGVRRLALSTELSTLPLSLTRTVTLAAPGVLRTDTTVLNTGADPVEFMWGEHIGFGGDLLDDPHLELSCSSADITADDEYHAASNPLTAGARSRWPHADGPDGPVDLRRPRPGSSSLAYLSNVEQPITVTAPGLGVAVAMRWSSTFPYVWLWTELGGEQGPPWFGKARAIGVEPFTSWPSQGLTKVAEKSGTQLRVPAGEGITGWVKTTVSETERTVP